MPFWVQTHCLKLIPEQVLGPRSRLVQKALIHSELLQLFPHSYQNVYRLVQLYFRLVLARTIWLEEYEKAIDRLKV